MVSSQSTGLRIGPNPHNSEQGLLSDTEDLLNLFWPQRRMNSYPQILFNVYRILLTYKGCEQTHRG